MVASGQIQRALELLRPFPESAVLPRLYSQAADWAISQGKSGRGLLPEALQGQFDLIQQGFAHAEAGRDEEARAALVGIGLQSPFLEWKLFLRGLVANYQGDEPRALENWQRLSQESLPARLAAPLRFTIDPAFRLAQPPDTQTSLQRQADRLQQSGLVQPLREIQAALANEHKLPQAFRLAENIMAALRQQAPHLVARLASCFYWGVINSGRPEDIPRYRRVFGDPHDDPHFYKLSALALEHRGQLDAAHKYWQDFEKDIANAPPGVWPGDQAQRVRALVWNHMGINAADGPDEEEIKDLPKFLRNRPDRPRPLTPGPEKCFERSLELAPDQLDTYRNLFSYYEEKEKKEKAIKVAVRLLERFPEHVPTLEALGDLRLELEEFAEALSLYQRALSANPLERRLRGKVSLAHLQQARQHAEDGEFEQARSQYQAALALKEGAKDGSVFCKWAACEFKAGNKDRAEELLAQALAEEGDRLAVGYQMLIEATRLKLPRPLKTRFDKDFKEAMAEPPTGQRAAAIALTAQTHQAAGVSYYGQKTHEKKVISYLEKAIKIEFTEEHLLAICAALAGLKAPKVHLKYIRLGQKKFPTNPAFVIAEVQYNLKLGPNRCPISPTQMLLEKAQQLITALPREKQHPDQLEMIKQFRQLLGQLSPFARIPSLEMLEDMFDFDEDDEDEYYDEDEDGYW
jgi:tetratricopeptide (TPR) repeat protein